MGIILQDQFTDTDTTDIQSHTIAPVNGPGVNWVEKNGSFEILSNVIRATTYNANAQFATVETLMSDALDIFLDVIIPDGNTPTPDDGSVSFRIIAGIIFRFVDTSNYWDLRIENDTHNVSNAYYMNFTKVDAGVVTGFSLTTGQSWNALTKTIHVNLNASTLTAYVNGVSVGSISDSFNESATQHGVFSFVNGEADILHDHYPFNRMDNFEIDGATPIKGGILLGTM